MRILVNGLSARLGGGQTYLRNLLLHAPQDNCRVFVLCQDSLDLTGTPHNVERLGTPPGLENPFRRALWERSHLASLAAETEADIVFSPGGLIPSALLSSRLKTAVTFQNMLPYDRAEHRRYPLGYRRLRDWLLRRGLSSAMRNADLVIFISDFARATIDRQLGTRRGHCVVVPHGVDRRFFADHASPKPEAAPEGEYYLYVSFIDHYKAQIEVLRAFSRLKTLIDDDAVLIFAGAEYKPYGTALRREVEKLGLQSSVRIVGNLPHMELPAWYQGARLNLFASRTENCPNILLEMMASNRPALVSCRQPMPEFGADLVTYFEPDDVNGLANAWCAAIGNLKTLEALARRAADRVAKMTWETSAKATWQAIETAARDRA